MPVQTNTRIDSLSRLRRNVFLAATTIFLTAPCHPALSAPLKGVHVTEPRNAAAGFAIVLWMANVDALEVHCSKLNDESGQQSMSAIGLWKKRNATYENAVLEYMVRIEEWISSKHGEQARQDFRNERKTEFVKSARDTEAVWFPDGKIDERSCLRLASYVANGSLDIDQAKEFLPTILEITADMESPQ